MLPVLALGLVSYNSLTQQQRRSYERNEGEPSNAPLASEEFVLPDSPAFSTFISNKYKISFKYPSEWVKNPRYIDKYEGKTGYFEVSDLSSNEGTLDEVTQHEINLPYKPYGSTPQITRLTVDGSPARLIYPSADQIKPLSDREAALIVQYKTPLTIEGSTYPYVIIWSDRIHMPLIIKTFKFIEQEKTNQG